MRLRLLPFILGLLMPLAAQAADLPEVIFDPNKSVALALDTPIRIDSRLIQVQLGEYWVLSAAEESEFVISRPESEKAGYLIRVVSGDVNLIDTLNDRLTPLPSGTRISGPHFAPCADNAAADCGRFMVERSGVLSGSTATDAEVTGKIDPHQNFQLSGAVMLRQQKYLDSIRIDIQDINKVFGSILQAFGVKK